MDSSVANSHDFPQPTKLIEYLAFEKPVLGLTEPESAIHDVLRDSGGFFAHQHEPEHIASVLEGALASWEAGSWGLSADARERILKYRLDNVNQKLDELFLRMMPSGCAGA